MPEKKFPLFSKSHGNPTDIVKILKGNMAILEKQVKKTNNICAKALILLLKYICSECKNLMKNPKYGL